MRKACVESGQAWWCMPLIPPPQDFGGQPGIHSKTLSQKHTKKLDRESDGLPLLPYTHALILYTQTSIAGRLKRVAVYYVGTCLQKIR